MPVLFFFRKFSENVDVVRLHVTDSSVYVSANEKGVGNIK